LVEVVIDMEGVNAAPKAVNFGRTMIHCSVAASSGKKYSPSA